MALDKKLVIRIEPTQFQTQNEQYTGYAVSVASTLDRITIRNFITPNKDDAEKLDAARALVDQLRRFFVLWTDDIEVREFTRG